MSNKTLIYQAGRNVGFQISHRSGITYKCSFAIYSLIVANIRSWDSRSVDTSRLSLSLFPHLLSRTIYLSTTFAHGNVDTRTWWFLERSSNCIRQSCVSSRRDSGYNRKRFQDDYPEDFAGTGLHYSCLQARIYIGIVSTTAGIYTVVDLQSRLLEAFLSVAQPTIRRTFLVTVKILLCVAVESLSKFSR